MLGDKPTLTRILFVSFLFMVLPLMFLAVIDIFLTKMNYKQYDSYVVQTVRAAMSESMNLYWATTSKIYSEKTDMLSNVVDGYSKEIAIKGFSEDALNEHRMRASEKLGVPVGITILSAEMKKLAESMPEGMGVSAAKSVARKVFIKSKHSLKTEISPMWLSMGAGGYFKAFVLKYIPEKDYFVKMSLLIPGPLNVNHAIKKEMAEHNRLYNLDAFMVDCSNKTYSLGIDGKVSSLVDPSRVQDGNTRLVNGKDGHKYREIYIKTNLPANIKPILSGSYSVFYKISYDVHETVVASSISIFFKLAGFIIVAVTFLFTYRYLKSRFINPIKKISSAMINANPVDTDVKINSIRELSILAETFNKHLDKHMSSMSRINHYNTELERKVETEVNKRREREKLLTHKSKLETMGEILRSIAHQWRQPLNTLALNIQDLEDEYEMGEVDREYVRGLTRKCMDNILTMSNSIDNFRSYFRPSGDKTLFNVKEAMHSALNMIAPQIDVDNIQVDLTCNMASRHAKLKESRELTENIHLWCRQSSFECGDGCALLDAVVYGYESEFKQAFINILTNARESIIDKKNELMKEKSRILTGQVNIELSKEGDYISIIISDNGTGIEESVLPNIFNPYFSTKDEFNGTGLGLYMAKNIIEKSMNGSIDCENWDHGAVFSIKLRLAKMDEAASF